MDMDNEQVTDDQSINLAEVVRAVKEASDQELKVLTEISNKLSGDIQVKTDRQERRKAVREQRQESRKNRRRNKSRTGEIDLSGSEPTQTPILSAGSSSVGNVKSASVPAVPIRNVEAPKSASEEVANVAKPPAPFNQRDAVQPISKVIEDGLSNFSDFWKDEKGRLRHISGRYASKEEKATYEQSAASVAQEREKEKGVVAKLIGAASGAAFKGAEAIAKNDAADTAGAAAGGSWFYAVKEMYQITESVGELASQIKEEGSLFDKAKGSMSGLFGKKSESQATMLDTAKEQSASTKQTSLIQEQTNDQITSNEKIIELLTEIADNKNGKDGPFDNVSIGDMFGRGGFGGKGKMGKAGKLGRMRSVLSGGKGAASVAGSGVAAAGGKKGLSIAGKAFKGVSTVAKGAGKLVPFLAPVLAAYDAYDGFTNAEKQRETFDLKKGQEATLGQKSAMATANVLNLGGLVSGGAGLLGDALGSIGFDGAKEALNFDVGDMTKGIYDFFGGNDEKKEEAVAKATEETAKALEVSASNSESATNSLTTASDKILKASENFLKATDSTIKVPMFSTGEYLSSSSVTTNVTSIDDYGVPASLSPTKSVNQSVTQIQASNKLKDLKNDDKAQLVRLDDQSIAAIGQSSAISEVSSSKNIVVKTPISPSKSVGVVPMDFSDGALRRQSADLE